MKKLMIGALAAIAAACAWATRWLDSPVHAIEKQMHRDFGAFRERLMRGTCLPAYETKEADLAEIKRILNAQGEAFEAFKRANDADIAALKKGTTDPLAVEERAKINKRLDELADALKKSNSAIEEVEKKFNRPGALISPDEAKKQAAELNMMNVTRRAYAQQKGWPQPELLTWEQYQDGKKAWDRYVRYGNDTISEQERTAIKAMSVGSDPDGGYLVPADTSGRMVEKIFESSPMRQVADVQVIGRDALEGLTDKDEANSGWVAEMGTRGTSATPQIAKWRIPVHEQYAMPEVTQQLLDDAAVDVEGWLLRKSADKFARTENTAFVAGDGVGKPRGFTTYGTSTSGDSTRQWGTLQVINTGTNASFGAGTSGIDKLIDTVHSLKAAYRTGATWAMSRATVGEVRKLRDGSGAYAWLPSMSESQPASLLGYGITEMEDMPAIGTATLSIAFANFKLGYQVVDRQGIRLLRDPYTNKPFIRLYQTKRVGGDVLHFEAIKFVRFGT